MPTFFIDTNVLWWYLVKSSSNHKKVKSFLDSLIIDIDNSFFVNEFVVIELLHLLIKQKGKVGYRIANNLFDNQFPFLKFLYDLEDHDDLDMVLEYLYEYGTQTTIGGRDSSIIYSLEKHNITNLISSDQGFESVGNIQLHNPLKES